MRESFGLPKIPAVTIDPASGPRSGASKNDSARRHSGDSPLVSVGGLDSSIGPDSHESPFGVGP